MAEQHTSRAQPGWRDVVLVAAAVVAVVAGLAVATGLLPAGVQRIVYETPLAIAILILGTCWLLWRVSRRPPAPPAG